MKTKKILHVVYAMNLGGIESWLMHLYRKVAKEQLQFDFLVNIQNDGVFDDEIKKLGGEIIFGEHYKNPIKQYIHLTKIFRSRDKYSAIHIHNLESASIIHLALRNKSEVPIIMQSHNDFNKRLHKKSIIEKVWLRYNKIYVNKFFRNRIAVSKSAGKSLFKKNFKIIPIGEDFTAYQDQKTLLKKLDFGFKKDDVVISHIGRFFLEKNHLFLLKLFLELKKRNNHSFKCLLIGEGPKQRECIEFVNKHNLKEDVLFLNSRRDVPSILKDVSDLFVFPSIYEGLGLAAVEAQAAGLPVVCSSTIPNEAIIIPELVKKIDLNADIDLWVNQIEKHYENNKNYSKEKALKQIMKSNLNIEVGEKQLIELWTKK